MKAISWLVSAAVAVAVCSSAGAVEPFEKVLPQETVVYVSVRDVPDLLQKVRQQPLYAVMTQEGFFEALLPVEAYEEAEAFYKTYVELLGSILEGEVAFALLGLDMEAMEPSPMVVLADVAGTEGAMHTYLEDVVYPWLDANEEVRREEVTIAGTTLTRIAHVELDEATGALGIKDGVFMLFPSYVGVESFLEALGTPRDKNLVANEGFADVRRVVGEGDVLAYVDVGAFVRAAKEAMAEYEYDPAFDTWGRVHAVTGFTRLRAIGLGMALGPEWGTTTVRVSGDGPRGGPFAGLARKAPPLKSTEYVADDAAFFAAVSLGSLSQAYSDFTTALERFYEASPEEYRDRPKQAVAAIEALLQTKLAEELLPAFGGEIAVAAWIPPRVDVPPGALMIEVKDKTAVAEFVRRMVKHIDEAAGDAVTAMTWTYKGVEIATLAGEATSELSPDEAVRIAAPIEDMPNVIPSVAIVDDFLVIATNPSVVEGIVETRAAGKHLGLSAGYSRYVSAIPGDATITVYMDTRRIFEFGLASLKELLPMTEEDQGPLQSIEALGGALSPLGMKVKGDENGITITSRSDNGGLAPFLLVGAFVARSSVVVVSVRTPGTSEVEFGEPGGSVPQRIGEDETTEEKPKESDEGGEKETE